MIALSRVIKSFAANESGATALEYGMICSLIVLAILAAVQSVAGGTIAMYELLVAAMG
jgi:pilus assembly protein Flp/PilA